MIGEGLKQYFRGVVPIGRTAVSKTDGWGFESLHPCQFSASLFSYITHEFKITFSPNWRVRSPMGFDKLSGTICTAQRRLRSGTGKYVSTSLHPCQFFSFTLQLYPHEFKMTFYPIGGWEAPWCLTNCLEQLVALGAVYGQVQGSSCVHPSTPANFSAIFSD